MRLEFLRTMFSAKSLFVFTPKGLVSIVSILNIAVIILPTASF